MLLPLLKLIIVLWMLFGYVLVLIHALYERTRMRPYEIAEHSENGLLSNMMVFALGALIWPHWAVGAFKDMLDNFVYEESEQMFDEEW